MKTRNFEFGDKVFDIRHGWGKVANKFSTSESSIHVLFNDGGRIISYTADGKHSYRDYSPSLSHTEYSIHSTKSEYPKIMEVSDDKVEWYKRVVFMEKKGRFVSWLNAETLEEAEYETMAYSWEHGREVQEHREISMQEIANKFGISVEEVRIKK